MRVLQIVKTTDGAKWAVDQVAELCSAGIDVHVALPNFTGRLAERWQQTGATLHCGDLDMPVRRPWELPAVLRLARQLVDRVAPDIIHSHFFGPTLVLRYALGKQHPIPRIFQVPGPLHLEHAVYRHWELSAAGRNDYWVASSRYVKRLYENAGVSSDRLCLSYYGNYHESSTESRDDVRAELGIAPDALAIGNVSFMYPPKYYLGQTKGLKRHEDLLDALGLVLSNRSDVQGVLVGGQWGKGHSYESRLRARARRIGKGRILMPGRLSANRAVGVWSGFDLAVHIPASENCGGVVEPMLSGVPVIASHTGGLPEVVVNGITGRLVEPGNTEQLACTIEEALNNIDVHRRLGARGKLLVSHMFDVRRTAHEIRTIYEHFKNKSVPPPSQFDSRRFVNEMMESDSNGG